MREVLFAFLIFIAGGLSGYFYKTCPVPKSPEPVIKEVEKIRTIEKPVIKEVTKNVTKIVKEPFYIAGDCYDDVGVQHLNNLIRDTSAGRADISVPTPRASQER